MYSVLIVEDEFMIRASMRTILERSDLPVKMIFEASNGEEALQKLSENIAHILLVDIRMPKMDGLELCRRLKKRCPQIEIIIVSGYDDFKYAQEAIMYGVKEYLLKPVSEIKIIRAVKKIINNIEESNRIFNIPFDILEEIIQMLEEGIWYNKNDIFEQGLRNSFEIFKDLPLHHCEKIFVWIKDTLLARLALKIGYSFNVKIDDFDNIDKGKFNTWFVKSINTIREEINERKANADYNFIEYAKNFIKENYNTDFALEDIAQKTGFNASYFSQLFKEKTGKTFVHYKSEIRLLKAKELLCRQDKSVTEVTYEVGYNNVSHFIKSFKKFTGETPSEYKERTGAGK